ncbi:peptidoglycan DD-metalloendopeptidase family protein [Floridanema evergladense]|uniref:Peptidoglycan DD-metalloendopeptidase family protein n=1 Tax=Floridaenema evergladense BLCC-F167 TaxID=3153639 RepID=A0ABV4WHI6_9CYAN
MKRALTHKTNPIPACAADDCSMVGSLKPIPPEVNRRTRTSAAMIGLAISMGASSSVLLTSQGDSAVAAEPIANASVSTVTTTMTETMGSQEVKSVTGEALEPKLLAHQAQDFTDVGSSQNRNIEGSESQSVTTQPAVVSETPDSDTATASSVDQLLKVKQAVALNRLKESSNRLRNSLAEWKSEESSIKSSVPVSEPAAPIVISRQLQPIVESSSSVEPVSPQWQAQLATLKPAEAVQPAAKAELGQQLQVEEPTVSVVYQVKPGDTIDAIARRYSISVATLAKVNQLANPNRIRVSQQLKVPQNTVSALPISTQQLSTNSEFQPVSPNLAPETGLNNSAPNLPVVSALLPQPTRENAPADVTAAAFPLTQTGTDDIPGWNLSVDEPEVETISAPGTGNKFLSASKPTKATNQDNLSAQAPNNQLVLAEDVPNQEPENKTKQYSNPYVERLRAEILQLRQHGRQPANNRWYGRTATPPAADSNNSAAQLRGTNRYPVNPDFRPNQYNQALQAEIQRRAQEAPANFPRTSYGIPQTQPTRQQTFATAPFGAEQYQPYNQNLPGQTVTPDLPPIENPYYNYPQQMTGYIWPARGVLTSGYGWRWGRMHRGIDIAAPTGTPIFASAPGVVVYARWNSGGYGNLVQIRHPDGSLTRYAHNSRIFVQEGQIVEQGQNIAAMGSTGRSTGPHSHFEIHPDGQRAVNPMAFLPSRRDG